VLDGVVQVVSPSDAETELIPLSPPPEDAPVPVTQRRRRAKPTAYAAVAVIVLGVVVVAGLRWTRSATGSDTAQDDPIAVQTAEVVRTDLSNSTSLGGTLGYGTARSLKGARDGIVTWLPAPGASIKRGKQLYRVDDEPVPLFYGGLPLFRTLGKRNTTGRDVRVVADNLKALGYAIGRQPRAGEKVTQTRPAPDSPPAPAAAPTPTASGKPPAVTAPPKPKTISQRVTVRTGDGVLTRSLIDAIKDWQKDSGLPVTGQIGAGDVLVLTGAVRVNSVAVQLGDGAAGPLMSVTPTTKVITVGAEAAEAGSIEQGDKVTVELPNDETVPGKVTAVGTALQTEEGGGGDPNAAPKLTVTVTLDDPKKVAKLDSADVQVDFVAETHPDVLAVPVGALVALSEGGYAVQLAGAGLVAVETRMFAKGLVEVTGTGLAEGADVVTTS
jgi:hypothetical protein